MTQKTYNWLQWVLFAFALIAPTIAWGTQIDWQVGSINGYQWFPLFGLLAWMVMWTHYVTGAIRLCSNDLKKSVAYAKISAYTVLLALLLHPGILAFKQYQADQGIPPQSFIDFVGEGFTVAVLLGSLSLTLFLSFEVLNRLRQRQIIKKWWKYISITQSVAMVLIFVHALRLGVIVTDGWFQIVWFVCGLSLLLCFYVIHEREFNNKEG